MISPRAIIRYWSANSAAKSWYCSTSMMGAVCMTASGVAGYGAIGTISGYPVSQVIRKL